MRLKTWLLLTLAAGSIAPADLSAMAADVAPSHVVARPSGFCPRGISWRVAENHVGQRSKVYGPVRSTFYARGSRGRPTFLNLGRRFPNPQRFTVVIWGHNRHRFPSPPEDLYRREFICVSGRIRLFEGVPQTFAPGPGAIDIRGES